MYNVSEQFHSAVFENSPETQIMFRFTDGTVLTNEDIHLASGIKVTEAANYEEELTIGACLSSTLSATFMNYHGLLSGYAFGECEVSLGVKTDESVFIPSVANVTAIRGFGTGGAIVYTGHSTAPYLKANGSATAEQPPFPVEAIVVYEGKILCIGSEGQAWTSSAFPATVNTGDFMKQKYVAMAKAHTGFDLTVDVLHVFSESGLVEKYEFAKLGVFKIDTPKKRNTNLIAVTTAYDKMRKFDVSANAFLGGLTYPITLGAMLTALCAFAGVTLKSSTFTNSTHSVSSVSLENTEVTAKDILRWIAEAACSFARMTRDGKVEMGWFASAAVEIPATQCFKIDIADYSVAVIDKLEILSSETSINAVVGAGTNSYLIINNPFLKGVTPGDVAAYGTPIYNKLAAFPAFYPIAATAVCDWSVQAGDIIAVEFNGDNYALPVYCQTITWKGDAKVSYESTGSERRPVMDAATRAQYTQGKELFDVQAGVEAAVKQGEPYNDVTISHANGVVVSAVIGGKTINVKLNGQDGLGIYDGSTYKGGVAIVGGEVAVVSNILTNNINGDCYATIGDVVIDGTTHRGIFVYLKSYSTSVPVAKIVASTSGAIRFLTDTQGSIELRNDGTFVYFDGSNSLGRVVVSSSGDAYLRSGDSANHRIGVDNTGPYYTKAGARTNF